MNLTKNVYSLLEPLARVFPNIEKVHIENYERSEIYLDGIDNIKLLHRFPRLRALDLVDVEMTPVYYYLEEGGGEKITSFR